jgi:hypothetical protein
MTRQEVIAKLVLPPGERADDDGVGRMLGGDTVLLIGLLFGLPDSRCFGYLDFKQDRIVEIQKVLLSTADAVALTRSLFLELRRLTEKGATATVHTWSVNEDGLSKQFIRFSFGEEAVQVGAFEGQISGDKIGPDTTLFAILSRK